MKPNFAQKWFLQVTSNIFLVIKLRKALHQSIILKMNEVKVVAVWPISVLILTFVWNRRQHYIINMTHYKEDQNHHHATPHIVCDNAKIQIDWRSFEEDVFCRTGIFHIYFVEVLKSFPVQTKKNYLHTYLYCVQQSHILTAFWKVILDLETTMSFVFIYALLRYRTEHKSALVT